MPTSLRLAGATAVLEVKERLIIGAPVDDFRNKWSEALAQGAKHVIVSLKEVPMMDSSGIGALIRCHSAVTGAGGKLFVVSVSDVVMQALKVTRLDQILQIHASEEAALSSLGTAG